MPVDSTTTFISPHQERIVHNNGTRQTLIGGLYVLEVEKNGQKTYADIVVHPDLSVETIRRLVLNDELRRSSPESPVVRETMSDSQVVSPDSVNASYTTGGELLGPVDSKSRTMRRCLLYQLNRKNLKRFLPMFRMPSKIKRKARKRSIGQ